MAPYPILFFYHHRYLLFGMQYLVSFPAQWKDAGENGVRMILMVDQGTQYRPPPLAKFFHALPHVNISLHLVNSTFNPDSDIYLEVFISPFYVYNRRRRSLLSLYVAGLVWEE